jgi:hypothetical protein
MANLVKENSVEASLVEARRVGVRKVDCPGWALVTERMADVMTKASSEATRVQQPWSQF